LVRTLDRAAVALRAIFGVCLHTLAVTAVRPGPHAGHASAGPSAPPVHVVGVAVGGTSVGHRAVEVRLAAPLPTATTASVSLGTERVRWACASRTGHPRLLTCPVSGPAAQMSDPRQMVVVHI
jgi:hypothetical protein